MLLMKKKLLILITFGCFAVWLSAQNAFKGSDYHLIFLDTESVMSIPTNEIKGDYRPNASTYFIYVWSNTYTGITATGKNSNDIPGQYLNLQIGTVGWSGLGFCADVNNGGKVDFTSITNENADKYYLHIALKSESKIPHLLQLQSSNGLSFPLCIGRADFVDKGIYYKPDINFARDGEWHLIEVPMTHFFNKGLRYRTPFNDNYMTLMSGNYPGDVLGVDAIFIYKKSEISSIDDEMSEEPRLLQTARTLSLIGTHTSLELYNLSGMKVKISQESLMGIDDVIPGIYFIRSGNFVKKVYIK